MTLCESYWPVEVGLKIRSGRSTTNVLRYFSKRVAAKH